MTGTIDAMTRSIIDRVYPVGIMIDFATEIDPNAAVGCGTVWQRIADGRVLIASDINNPVGYTGGEPTHVLTEAEMPNHFHAIAYSQDGNPLPVDTGNATFPGLNMALTTHLTKSTENLAYFGTVGLSAGANVPHNNMQPFMAVCRWKRTA